MYIGTDYISPKNITERQDSNHVTYSVTSDEVCRKIADENIDGEDILFVCVIKRIYLYCLVACETHLFQ